MRRTTSAITATLLLRTPPPHSEMHALEVVELSATISELLTRANPLFITVTKVIDQHTFETTFAARPIPPEDFWQDDHDHRILTADEKQRRYVQLQRSVGCQSFVLAFVVALQKLCQSGVPLHYEGHRVVDIWVMNTTELDVSDIPQDRILRLRDPISGIVVPAMSTHENKDLLRQIGKDVCLRFGFHVPPKEADDEARRAQRIEAYKGTVPHWWVAVIVEGTCGEVTERRMVHLDVCGAAYDDTAFRMHEGAPVSLQVFATSEYDLVPAKMFGKSIGGEDLSHKFVMTSSTTGPGNRKYCSLHPLSVRHLRCFHWKEKVGVEVTPVDTFIKRNMRGFPGCYDRWLDTVVQLQHKFLLRAPAGTEVIVCKLQKRRDLNGKKAVVHASNSTGAPTDRIPVLVEGLPNPVSIKPSCARLPSKRAYSSFDELLSRVDAVNKLPAELPKPLSRKTRASLQKRLAADAELRDAMEKLTSGKVTISYYGDAEFVRGIRRLSEPPFDALLPASMIASIRDGLEVADHPQAEAVFAILKVCRSAKLKALQRDPGLVRGGGGVAISEECELFRLLQSVAKKIRASAGLMEVFEAMDRKGLFHNPVRKVG